LCQSLSSYAPPIALDVPLSDQLGGSLWHLPTPCRLWTEACGKEYALVFHAREPLLLAQPPAALLLSLEHLATVFELAPEAAVALALRSPTLIGVPLEQLRVGAVRKTAGCLWRWMLGQLAAAAGA
jgi:hypothetical protein